MWAAAEDIELQINRRVSAAEKILSGVIATARDSIRTEATTLRLGNNNQWEKLNDRITALQAIDTTLDGRERGKIIIIATVAGQDIIKIIDIPRGASIDEHKRMMAEIKERYGARVEFIDGPPVVRQFFDCGDSAARRAAARDRGFMR